MATKNSIDSNIPIEIAKGGTNATTMATTNGVNYFDSTRIVTTSAGTSTNVLTSNGPGVAPTYQATAAGDGDLIFIQSQTASTSAEIAFTTGLIYTNYLIIIRGACVTPDAGQKLVMQVSTDGGSSYITTGYQSGVEYVPMAATTPLTNLSSTADMIIYPTPANISSPQNNAYVYLYNFNSTGYITYVVRGFYYQLSDTTNYQCWGGGINTNSTVNAFRFVVIGGAYSILEGTFELYGIKNS